MTPVPPQELIALRAHRPDRPTLAAHRRLVRSFGKERVVVVADEATSPPQEWPGDVDVVHITRSALEELGISTAIPDSGWRCGDYALYVLFAQRAVERAWLMEPDVAFSGQTPREFVERFADDPADFVVHSMTVQKPEGFWYGTLSSRGFTGEEWHSFFPLVRVTRAAVIAAAALRREVQDQHSDLMHPNDESVVATAVVLGDLNWTVMKDRHPEMFRRFSPGRRLPLLVLKALYRGPQVFHPVGRPDLLKPRRKQEDVTGAPMNG